MTPRALSLAREVGELLSGILCITASAYYVFALFCAVEFFRRRAPRRVGPETPITVLKPVCGLDRGAYENFASFCRQRYSRFEIIFGSEREDDAGLVVARRVAHDFPDADVRVVVHSGPPTANPKVGLLGAMAAQARYPLLLVSDSDIRVRGSHLSALAAPMADPGVGVVTCLYRSNAKGFAGRLDAIGLTTDFQPSVLVARRLEGISFGMGSGTLVRADALATAGGFAAIEDFLADDYLLGHLPVRAGYRAELSPDVVEHELDVSTLRQVIEHQTRWNRGIRAMRPFGYAGLLLTQGVPASALLLAVAGSDPRAWMVASTAVALRLLMAWFIAVHCLRDRIARGSLWLVPVRDLLGFGLWGAAFFGNSIVWRGRRLRLASGGRLCSEPAPGDGRAEADLVHGGLAS
jgi:ceramide glucosyltransferase